MHLERLCMLLFMQIHALALHYSTRPCTWGRFIDKYSVGEHAIWCYIVRYRILLMLWSSRVCRCQPERTLFLEKIDLTHSFKQNWTQKIIWSNANYCFRVRVFLHTPYTKIVWKSPILEEFHTNVLKYEQLNWYHVEGQIPFGFTREKWSLPFGPTWETYFIPKSPYGRAALSPYAT